MQFIFSIVFLFWGVGSPLSEFEKERTLSIHLQPSLYNQPIRLSKESSFENQDITIKTFKFYLSNFLLSKSGKVIWKEKNSYHLVDASDTQTLHLAFQIPDSLDFDQLQFNVGIDSITNISGVFGGDLDPTKGMYWAWNSGYINFKLEGRSPLCPGRNNEFQFHLGGYLSPFESMQNIQLKVSTKNEINVKIELSKFLEHLDLSRQYKVMSPGAAAQKLSQIAATIFYVDEE
jgi:methanobactin biosynthesis MbnP-like protein